MTTTTLSPEQRIENVRQSIAELEAQLPADVTPERAKRAVGILMTMRAGGGIWRRQPQWVWTGVAILNAEGQLRGLLERQAAGTLGDLIVDELPF